MANAATVPRSHRCMIHPLACGHPPIGTHCAARMLRRGGHFGEIVRGNLLKESWAYGTSSDGNLIRRARGNISARLAVLRRPPTKSPGANAPRLFDFAMPIPTR